MKQALLIFAFLLVLTGCKKDVKQEQPLIEEPSLTAAELIAKAHGIDHWNKVSEISFTFSVDRDTIEGAGRSWTWMPKKDSVVLQMADQTIKYARNNVTMADMDADRAFINDKFWLLIPFQLIWDKGTTISEPTTAEAPISGTAMKRITTTYPSEGGYTPGDAYDIYFDDDYMIREWTFRKGNSPEPTLSTTFEDYKDIQGLKIATSHKRDGEAFNLKFRDLQVLLD
jgi:uncharacterized lipoprotein YehR (DUF1307 family)